MSRLAVVLLLLGAWSARTALQDPSGIAPHRMLEIDAVPLDRNGNVLTDVRRDELEVWIEHYRIPIETFIAITPDDDRARRSLVLLLDDITIHPSNAARVRDVARRFVNHLGAADQMAVIGLDGNASRSTSDRAELVRTIDAYNPGATGPIRADDLSAHVLTTLTSISRQIAESPARRRTIVAIGPQWLFDTPIPPPSLGREVRAEWTEAVRAMALAHVTLYVIDPGGVGASPVSAGDNGFARETGGFSFSNTNDMDRAAERIMREAVSYYILRIADPPIFQKESLRGVDVRILRRGATIRAARYLPGLAR
jgi:VWFA-related protein